MAKFIQNNSQVGEGDFVVEIDIRRAQESKCYVPVFLYITHSKGYCKHPIEGTQSIDSEEDLPHFLTRVVPHLYAEWDRTGKTLWLLVRGDEDTKNIV